MKKINYFNALVLLLVISFSFIGCKSDDGVDDPIIDAEQEAMEEYSRQWKAISVTRDDANYEGYGDFILTITEDKKFQTSGDPNEIFPTGPFQFIKNTNYKKVTCNGIDVNLTVNGDNLLVNFIREGEDSNAGRTVGIAGDYQFNLKAVE